MMAIFGSVAIGYLAGFINHQIGDWTLHLKLGSYHRVPILYGKGWLYRGFLYVLVAVLTVVALFISPHWFFTGSILIWVLSSWKSGYHYAYLEQVNGLAEKYMEDEHLSQEKSEEKSRETLKILLEYS